ncbi:MAG: hypothetical protein E4G99_10460 [Anaerolineales bacterium]|nr:MAG: hypothetical protein E4G99_10460 [Anaerolineales bacterium]
MVVEDDDGDSAEVSVIKLIAGQFLCPQSQGFWKHQVSAKGKPHVDESTLLSYLEMIAWASSYFGDKESLESLDDARDVIEIVEMILLLEQPTHDELVKAKDLAKAVNKSSKGQNACDE